MQQAASTSLSFTKLFVTDFDRTVDFFSNILGLRETDRFVGDEAGRVCDEILYSTDDGVALVAVGYRDGQIPPARSDVGAGIEVADLATVVERVKAAGCKVESAGSAEDVQVHTPDGHLVILKANGSAKGGEVRSVRLVVGDLDRNIAFFEKVLGVGVRERHEKAQVSGQAATEAILDIQPRLSLVAYREADAPQPTGATYAGFIVKDLQKAIESAQALGSDLVRGAKPSGGGPLKVKSAIITGPEGHRLELAEVV